MDFSQLFFFATEQAVEHAAEPGVIGTLGLNWKLFLAQLINFSIVLFILWKWVFRPVVGALENRREKIERSLKRAEEIERRVKDFEKSQAEQLKKSRIEAEAIIAQATDAAASVRHEIVEKARHEAERILAESKATIDAEKKQMLRDVRAEVAGLTMLATEKILRQKLDKHKDQELVAEILSNIK